MHTAKVTENSRIEANPNQLPTQKQYKNNTQQPTTEQVNYT